MKHTHPYQAISTTSGQVIRAFRTIREARTEANKNSDVFIRDIRRWTIGGRNVVVYGRVFGYNRSIRTA